MVSEDFRFLMCYFRAIWDQWWWRGDRAERIGSSYRFLKKYDVTIKKKKQYLSEARTKIIIY